MVSQQAAHPGVSVAAPSRPVPSGQPLYVSSVFSAPIYRKLILVIITFYYVISTNLRK